MEDTCVGKKCWFYLLIKELIGNKEDGLEFKNCPFYQEMIFTPSPMGTKVETAKTIHDCTNKRSLLILLEEVFPRLLGLQQANEESRNSTENAKNKLIEFVEMANAVRDSKIVLREIQSSSIVEHTPDYLPEITSLLEEKVE